jgi:DNA invertase Pin-like site-specific DNA recombinase
VEKVFKETASGARGDHAQLRRVLVRLGKGDVLMVTRLDSLGDETLAEIGRSYNVSGWTIARLSP